ncbi:FAD-dependent oxidoreductase [Actinomadura vinacea]|uniref:FAD-dependent oxidoreductase n=1 Tax=Actinomadura vinacea TaxID=115336 RepID=A0ABN3JPH0_9ACTN
MTTIAIVGTGLAGVRAAETLRAEGYHDRLVMVGDEAWTPYDRPPLSKAFLLGSAERADLRLLDEDGLAALGAEWRLGTGAAAFHARDRMLRLDDGHRLTVDGLVIATGARARRLDVPAPPGVHTLRTLDDAIRLRADLLAGSRAVLIGGGFVGAEIASTARRLGNDLTIVEAGRLPLLAPLGEPAASLLARLHADNEVRVITGRTVRSFEGRRHVRAVILDDGRRLPADTVVVGIGAVPNVEWLDGSGVGCAGGVPTDPWGRTNVPGVVAAGDVAGPLGRRLEHWTNARDMPVTACKALLAEMRGQDVTALPCYDPLPYVWSDQYDSRIQLAGRPAPDDDFLLEEGAPEGAFVATYRRAGAISAVLALDSPRTFTRFRHELRRVWAARQDSRA